MILHQFYLNCLAHASYLIGDEQSHTAAVVDPQRDIEQYVALADAHDLRMQRVGGTRVYAWPLAQSGAVEDKSVRLLRGRYRLWCSVANHRALGMTATLVVK